MTPSPAEPTDASFSPITPSTRRQVVLLPPIDWLPSRQNHVPGREPDVACLERALANLGVDATIIDPLPWPWNPLRRRPPLLRGIDPLRTLRVLLFHRHAAAIIPVFEGPALLLALLRRLVLFQPRLILWDLSLDSGWRIREWMQNILVPRVDVIAVLGSNQVTRIAARWPRHGPIACIGHYLDTTFWRPMPPAADTETGYVLCVGDDGGRDYPMLLDAAAAIGCPLLIRSARDLVLDPIRQGNVRQIRQRVSFQELRALYAGAALVVVPLFDQSHASGVTAVLEAGAMGCAMLVSNSAGVRDWIEHDQTAIVVPCNDIGAFTAALTRLLADEPLRRRLGTAARNFVEQRCTAEIVAQNLVATLS